MEFLRNIEPYKAMDIADFVVHKGNRISSKAIIDNESLEIRFFSASAGEEIDKERYEFESIFICIVGCLKMVFNENDEIILNPGQMIAFEKGVDYGLKTLKTSSYYNILVNN
jgi:quercetin dioxygenase-like cupin family protein